MENGKVANTENPITTYFRDVVRPAIEKHHGHRKCIEEIQRIGNEFLLHVQRGEAIQFFDRLKFESEIGNVCTHGCSCMEWSTGSRIGHSRRMVACEQPSGLRKIREKTTYQENKQRKKFDNKSVRWN
jgi:hypothetical protein